MLLARQIGGERHDNRRDGAGALQRAPGDRHPDVVRPGRDKAAGGEDDEADIDHGLASPAIRRHAEGNLQDRLRKAVCAKRDADEREVVAAGEMRRVHREHRQDEEETEHAQPEHTGEAHAGAQFGCAHAFRVQGEVRRESEARYSSKFRFFDCAPWTSFAFAARARTT